MMIAGMGDRLAMLILEESFDHWGSLANVIVEPRGARGSAKRRATVERENCTRENGERERARARVRVRV